MIPQRLLFSGEAHRIVSLLPAGLSFHFVVFEENLTIVGFYRPDEAELFAKSAQNAYEQFRDKAAFSRSMPVCLILMFGLDEIKFLEKKKDTKKNA